MEFALNYSHAAAQLLGEGRIQIDCFKCPAWPNLIAKAQGISKIYVHFPLKVGTGIGGAVDTETKQPADYAKIEAMLAQTGTPLVNAHLEPTVEDYPDIPADTVQAAHVEMLTEHAIRDVRGLVERFGPGRVVVENDHHGRGRVLRPAYMPEVIRRVVEETDCGLLLDVSHARLAAHHLGMDAQAYIAGLPTERTHEIHVSGIQRFEGRWVEMARQAGIEADLIQQYRRCLVDHLPIIEEGWTFYVWALEQVHRGTWGKPWVITFEYGGVGKIWEMVTDKAVLAEQVPRLHTLVKGLTGQNK
jgi:uncharacterized protein (UPF0276 family)